jgi:hypothetical protein
MPTTSSATVDHLPRDDLKPSCQLKHVWTGGPTVATSKYRRLLFWDICRDDHSWEDMVSLASMQDVGVTWHMLSPIHERAIVCANGYEPLGVDFDEAMQQPL